MSNWKKYQSIVISMISLLAALILLFTLGDIFLPFLGALFVAYLMSPLIKRFQRFVKSRNLAITLILLLILLCFGGGLIFMGSYVIKDTKRFIHSVDLFVEQNQAEIDKVKSDVSEFFGEVYESDFVQDQLVSMQDSTTQAEAQSTLTESLGQVYTLFSSSSTEETPEKDNGMSGFMVFMYFFIYLIPILYTYEYFTSRLQKYFGGNEFNSTIQVLWKDFDTAFITYFKQRSKIVLICASLFVLTFLIMGLPGAVIIGIIAGLLTYASHFHYITLLPISIGCWVLSMEHEISFFIFFGIVLVVFIVISILDEMVFFPKIMKSVSGMNPAIMILAFTLWIYIFGGFIGTIVALPLTNLVLIYLDRFLLRSRENPGFIREQILQKGDSEKLD